MREDGPDGVFRRSVLSSSVGPMASIAGTLPYLNSAVCQAARARSVAAGQRDRGAGGQAERRSEPAHGTSASWLKLRADRRYVQSGLGVGGTRQTSGAEFLDDEMLEAARMVERAWAEPGGAGAEDRPRANPFDPF
jgi:hypothetical protein